MRYLFETEEHALLRQSIRRFAEIHVAPFSAAWEEDEGFPRELYARAAAAGVLGVSYPEALGGGGGDITHSSVAGDEMITAGNSVGVTVGLGSHGIASMHAAQSLSGEYLTVFHDAKRLALSGSAAGRLARLLLDWARSTSNGRAELKFTMALTHEEVANMAGTSRETVTRLLNQFRRDQWLTIKGASITITKPEQLERLTV